MKVVRYDWENSYINRSISRTLLSYDYLSITEDFKRVRITNTAVLSRSIDQTKLLSLNFVFSNNNRAYLGISLNKDKNPLKKVANKSTNTRTLVQYKIGIDAMFYIVFVYLYNYFLNKNILFGQKINKNILNMKVKEINSILKVGHSYNVLDLDPPVEFSFVFGQNTHKTLRYFLDR